MRMAKYAAAFMILSLLSLTLTGCGSFYSGISKDTVMVKKIPQEKPGEMVEYNGVLSEDTVKTLSVNAVNKYFEHNLSLDDILIEMSFMDQTQIKSLLADATRNVDMERGFLVEYKEPLKKVAGGVYMATMMNKYDSSDVYGVVINARDGEVLGLSKVNMSESSRAEKKLTYEDLTNNADEFVKGMGDYKLNDLQLEDSFYLRGGVEFYYKNKNSNEVVLSLLVDMSTGQIIGFYKDMMTILQFIIVKEAYLYQSRKDIIEPK